MRLRTKLAAVEKRMQVGDLARNCPLCRTRPGEVILLEYEGQAVPPSKAPPCPLCGKGPGRVVVPVPLMPPE